MARPKNSEIPIEEVRRRRYHPIKLKSGGWKIGGHELPACNLLTARLFAFKNCADPEGKEYLFWKIADQLWNKDPDPENWMFAKHAWSWKMIHEACNHKFLAIGGAGSCGKSYTFAGWAIVNWLADPANTMILVTSTDLGGARNRIWGAIMKLLDLVPDPPCKIRDAIGVVAYYDGNKAFSTSGIKIQTADKSKTKDKMGKMIGIKAKKVILIADELGEMGPNVQSAATGNLAKNPSFQMVGLSNPSSRFDPFGVFAEPKGGWDSVNVELEYEWTTKLGGKYVRIDSEQSPNIVQHDSEEYDCDIFFSYLPTQQTLEDDLALLGNSPEEARKSREYMRFNRAIFFDSNDSENIYTESELIRSGAMKSANTPESLSKSVLVAGLDLSFSSNGDKSVLTFMEVGYDPKTGQYCMMIKELVYIYEDMTSSDPRTLQIATKVMEECKKRNLDIFNLGIDASGSGGTWGDTLQLIWGPGFHRVQFGGSASSKKIKNDSKIVAKDRYKNRASELFFIGKQFLLGKQIHGIPPIIAQQMCNRRYTTSKGTKGIMLQVEPKPEYKSRMGSSPDEMDSFLVAVEVARTQHLLNPTDPVKSDVGPRGLEHYLSQRKSVDSFSADKMGFVANL